jgi:uncharacterized membrane protein YkvA (DUF1232 family)
MALEPYLPNVFVSHSWKDKIIAQQVTDMLRELNVATVWLDFENLRGGDVIDEALQRELAKMDYMLLVWTSNSAENKNVANEFRWAKQLGVKIIPCFFEFDPAGNISPAPNAEVAAILGIEFRKMPQGIVALSQIFQRFTHERLPEEVQSASNLVHPAMKAMGEINGFLVNYRNVRNTSEDRGYWINKICDSLAIMKADPEHASIATMFIEQCATLRDTDPEAYKVIENRFLKPAQQAAPPVSAFRLEYAEALNSECGHAGLNQVRREFVSMIHQENTASATINGLEEHVPDLQQRRELTQQLAHVVGNSIIYLNYAHLRARQLEKEDGFKPIMDFVVQYFADENDLQPDSIGLLGWIDDAYLCYASLLKINALYQKEFQTALIEDDLQPYADYCRSALSPDIAQQLDQRLETQMQSMDWNTILLGLAGLALGGLLLNALFGGGGGSGYTQSAPSSTSSSSSGHNDYYIEDRMARTAAELGISMPW